MVLDGGQPLPTRVSPSRSANNRPPAGSRLGLELSEDIPWLTERVPFPRLEIEISRSSNDRESEISLDKESESLKL